MQQGEQRCGLTEEESQLSCCSHSISFFCTNCSRSCPFRSIVGFVLLFYAFLLFYFLFRSWPPSSHGPQSTLYNTHFSFPKDNKPWPSSIPSFKPWIAAHSNLTPPLRSCEAYFGNGFSQKYSILEFEQKGNSADQLSSGSFQCHFSETLQTSICEGRQIVMDPQRISMAQGGELLESVIGRQEEDELPIYSEGAFQVFSEQNTSEKLVNEELLDKLMPKGSIKLHTMRMLLQSMQTIPKNEAVCSERIAGPTLFVTRFEYANLFHTLTDWYSAYASSHVIGLTQRPKVVLLDGHCKSHLDDGWKVLFSTVGYAKHFHGPVCFEHAIFSPLGYSTALFEGLKSGLPCRGSSAEELEEKFDSLKTARLREFGEFFTAAFQVPRFLPDGDRRSENGKQDLQLLFVRRENYMAHPRQTGRTEVRISNEKELFEALQKWASYKSTNHTESFKLTIVNGRFAHMTLAEQVRAAQASSIIIGAHGAGLTHIVFSNSRTVVYEFLRPSVSTPHFMFISQWLGLDYHSMVTQGFSVNFSAVVAALDKIVSNLVKHEHQVV